MDKESFFKDGVHLTHITDPDEILKKLNGVTNPEELMVRAMKNHIRGCSDLITLVQVMKGYGADSETINKIVAEYAAQVQLDIEQAFCHVCNELEWPNPYEQHNDTNVETARAIIKEIKDE
jgi:hypothetical protein